MERNLIVKGRTPPARLCSTMEAFFPQADVTDYASVIAAMQNDPKDRHAAAAAAKAGAQVIATSNLKGFASLPAGIEAQSPDEFLCDRFALEPSAFVEMLREQAGDLANPPVTLEHVLERLLRAVSDLVAAVRQYVEGATYREP